MIQTVIYGFTIGAILYFFSVGLSLTFGTMHIINFAHGMVYTLGVYLFITFMKSLGNSFLLSLIVSLGAMLPIAYIVERFVIRRLYGESLDYAIIATYGVLLIGTDAIKMIWGTTPYPVNDPVGIAVPLAGLDLPVYRILIVASAVLLYLALRVFFKRSIVGRIVTAALEDRDGVRCLGLDVNKYFSIVFVLGSALAVLGGILYAPVSTAEPYMGFHILLLAFAVVIVGGMGNLDGTFVAAMVLGMVMAVTGRFWSQAANAMVFVVMALVIIFRPMESN
jgi:branched-subunit amino acid ABC-type transport system permease component